MPRGRRQDAGSSIKKQVRSLQFPTIDGNAGGFDDEFGSLSATNGSIVLPGPPLALPEAEELVMLPNGKLEAGIDPGGKLTKRALVPAKPPTALLAPLDGVAGRRGRIDAAEIGADEAADDVVVADAGDVCRRRRDEARMVPRFTPAKPPR